MPAKKTPPKPKRKPRTKKMAEARLGQVADSVNRVGKMEAGAKKAMDKKKKGYKKGGMVKSSKNCKKK
jgi:hypothetical protein